MSIAVISDLHLGARPSTDLFGHDDAEFLRFLSFLERNFERIVLLGDIWETLTSSTPKGHAEELRQARLRHRELADRFRRRKYTYVHGNHDMVTGDMDGAPHEVRWSYKGARLLFAHGHQSDSLVVHARCVSESAVWLGGWIRRAKLDGAYKFFDRIDKVRGAYGRVEEPTAVETWAVAHARMQEADIVVTGHTHIPRRAEHGKHMFLNSGSCAEGNISFLEIDPRTGRYQVHDSY